VGYLAFSVADTLAGDWNVYSFWKQPTQSWVSSVINSEIFTFTKSGLLIPPGIVGTVSRTGATIIRLKCADEGTGTYYLDGYCDVVVGEYDIFTESYNGGWFLTNSSPDVYYDDYGTPYYYFPPYNPPDYISAQGHITSSFSTTTSISSGIYNSFILTISSISTVLPAWVGSSAVLVGRGVNSFSTTARTGSVVVTRPGNI
jgi:hypothetical protein